MAVTLNKANLVLKDANGNIGKIEQLSNRDLAKIKTAMSDVALVVNQSNHKPIVATTTNVGVVKPDNKTITIDSNGVLTATKAIQDSEGQQINTTYVKGVTASNATITVTKGNGTTSTATINNVANATNATNATNAANLGGYPATKYIRSVNSITPDASGNVQLGNVGAITGEIKWFAFNKVPTGYLVCNGASVSRTTYADLFNAIGTTFGKGNGSTTFTLPNLIDKFAQGSTTVGTVKSAGLPNISGNIGTDVPGKGNIRMLGDGAFTPNTSMPSTNILFTNEGSKEEVFYTKYKFNASLSNSIYGNSETVQPPTLTLLPCIKY